MPNFRWHPSAVTARFDFAGNARSRRCGLSTRSRQCCEHIRVSRGERLAEYDDWERQVTFRHAGAELAAMAPWDALPLGAATK